MAACRHGRRRSGLALDVLVEPDAGASLGHGRCERRLADFERIAAQVIAIQFNQVERI
jgi:hypothetical protein